MLLRGSWRVLRCLSQRQSLCVLADLGTLGREAGPGDMGVAQKVCPGAALGLGRSWLC